MRRVVVRASTTERIEAEARRLWALEQAGEIPEGRTGAWLTTTDAVLSELTESCERHPRIGDLEDPGGVGYRAVRIGVWRLIYRVTDEEVVVLVLRHVRERPSKIRDHER